MTYQDDDLLNPLRKWGCYMISIYNMVERENGTVRPTSSVLLLFLNALKAGWVDQEATVLDPGKLVMSMGGHFVFVGKVGADYKTGKSQREILCFEKPGHTHFVLGDGTGKVAFDPLKNHSMTGYKLVSKRIFEVV